MSGPDRPAAETSHPTCVAVVDVGNVYAIVIDREAMAAHAAICPSYADAAAAALLSGYRKRFSIFIGRIFDENSPAVCPHQRDLRRWRVDKSAFADTYDEAVALMHRWVDEYREERAE